jgi:general secretion pathway protein K
MIIVTLVATLASAMVWQQWRAVQIESAERARAQSAWVLIGALDWARLILREDARSGGSKANVDDLTEPWATPLAEARLSTFLAADKDNNATDDSGPEAFLSGIITDAQSRYDLTRLIGTDGQALKDEIATLARLCETVGLASSVATQISDGLNAAQATTPSDGAPLMPVTVDQLTWLGVDPAAVAALTPYVTLLPVAEPVNVNTAPREVIAAVAQVDLATAERAVQGRPYATLAAFTEQMPTATAAQTGFDVQTEYFEVRGRLRLADHVLEQISLVQRLKGTNQVTVVRTQRVAALDLGAPWGR